VYKPDADTMMLGTAVPGSAYAGLNLDDKSSWRVLCYLEKPHSPILLCHFNISSKFLALLQYRLIVAILC